jgi:NAD(P)-dependent dehydrogenase (short-subunit alcohol dehydrogenase family)
MTHNTTKQKTVLITGANNPEGIGAAIAKSFHNSGFKVISTVPGYILGHDKIYLKKELP